MVSNRAAEVLHSYQLTCCDLKQKPLHRTKRWTRSGGLRAFEMENLVWPPLGQLGRSYLASDFVVLVLSEAVLSETVLVLDGCLNCVNSDR